MSSQAGDARTFRRECRPVGRRALRFIASHEITPSTRHVNPEGLCPHRPVMHERFVASAGPSGDGPSGSSQKEQKLAYFSYTAIRSLKPFSFSSSSPEIDSQEWTIFSNSIFTEARACAA